MAICRPDSGNLFLAFSTANEMANQNVDQLATTQFMPNTQLDPLFEAVIRAVDESILNTLVTNETIIGFKAQR
ncbi:MAG: hypothetical protein HN453_11160 [Gammaproteobacteria bacterium]|nr:hypothetical protein [Gammaproteobacteria bacterium]